MVCGYLPASICRARPPAVPKLRSALCRNHRSLCGFGGTAGRPCPTGWWNQRRRAPSAARPPGRALQGSGTSGGVRRRRHGGRALQGGGTTGRCANRRHGREAVPYRVSEPADVCAVGGTAGRPCPTGWWNQPRCAPSAARPRGCALQGGGTTGRCAPSAARPGGRALQGISNIQAVL